MVATDNSCSMLTDEELYGLLTHVLIGPSRDHKRRAVTGLEELGKRIKSNSVQDQNKAVDVLLDLAKKYGNSQPEDSLIIESLSLLINKDEKHFQQVLDNLNRYRQEEALPFLIFSRVVHNLQHSKKRAGIRLLVNFLMTRDALNDVGAQEVYERLTVLGNERLGQAVVDEASPYLDSSFEICAVIFSVRLCSRFANHRLLPKMLEVLEKCTKGYFDGHNSEIEQYICEFLERIRELDSLLPLMNLLKIRYSQNHSHITRAIGAILDSHPCSIEYILEMLYDARNENLVDAILRSFEMMDKGRLDARKLIRNIRISWWKRDSTSLILHRLLVKERTSSKPALFEILKDEKKYDFAISCLKEIGVSDQELSKLFPKPVILQVYNFLYSQSLGKNIPKDLNCLWVDKKKLRENVPGNTNWLEHMLLHIFADFNFVTLNIAPLKIEGIDLVCFYPETFDLFIIGCTAGILKDDLSKIDAMLSKMEKELQDVLDKCSVTPIVVSSEIASISPSDEQYAAQNGIIILQSDDIEKLLEMLSTNRNGREVIEYIKSCIIIPDTETF